jgi:chromate reductase
VINERNPVPKKISVIVGSLRRGSYARKIANETLKYFPENYEAQIVEIRDLPLYDFDYDDPDVTDKPTPEQYINFRETIKNSDGVLFVTAENNRTVPACLKNAIDIGSKPNSDVAWKNLPAGIISHSVGRMGGYSSQKNLRLALSYFDMPTPGQPEVFLGQSPTLFDDEGRFNTERTVVFVQNYVNRFCQLVEEHARAT